MDVKSKLVTGLTSNPRYIPVWYRYDRDGSIFNDRCLSDNTYYYFYKSEVDVISNHVEEMVSEVQSPCVLIEMGSGNSEKSRTFIDAILKRQETLTYIPIDISEEFLKECSDSISKTYGESLTVEPIAGDYTVGIKQIRNIKGRKLIIWLGGGFQNQAYADQVDRIKCLAETMEADDRLVIALDISQNKTEVEHAYLDPTGISSDLYLNAIWRLNREYGSSIDTDTFELDATFEQTTDVNKLSKVVIRATSKCDQTYNVPGLDLQLSFTKGDYIQMHEGEGVSCKYTLDQIKTLCKKGNQTLKQIWTDNEKHVSLCCLATLPGVSQ